MWYKHLVGCSVVQTFSWLSFSSPISMRFKIHKTFRENGGRQGQSLPHSVHNCSLSGQHGPPFDAGSCWRNQRMFSHSRHIYTYSAGRHVSSFYVVAIHYDGYSICRNGDKNTIFCLHIPSCKINQVASYYLLRFPHVEQGLRISD